ncbi:HsdM family class I SAM-dependent methyltransferase [Rhodococcus sp. MEB064]|uniref:HsdM family class I SAM-dependent methyltransferase n=1 Tax=Rhodococcus sp. MEB064 TaxID=1587522 RepID=UPI0018CD01B9|nr:N-6 DNA methylase [Rhodococcus sp. MEB064]
MTAQKVLDDLVEVLGYRNSRGYVDDTVEPGDRGMIWTDLQMKCGVSAAFFKGSVPLVAFVAADTRDAAMNAHARLWNYGRVPVLLAATTNGVLALSSNTAQASDKPDAALLAEALHGQEILSVLADFTRFSVESGRLASRRSKQLDTQNRVDNLLLRNLRTVRSRLIAAGVHTDEIEPLLGRSIFVRYLEDRKILQPDDLRQLGQPASLDAALDDGWDALSSLFEYMSDHFNGDVFRRDNLPRALPQVALRVLSDFFQGTDLDTGQASLWRYDFAIIPPELISSIYEQLLAPQQKNDAAYYTPRRVVDLVLDEVLPIHNGPVPPTVLDPACGSGIFLTEAFRRLAYRRRAFTTSRPSYSELSTLLVESIFGIDRNPDAIGVTAFSLYLALLEHVEPRTIWRDVRLPDLVGTNLVISDTFTENQLSHRQFDIIAGNPPWQSTLTPDARKYLHNQGRQTPDQQIAVPFIWKVQAMLNPGGTAGLVLPAKTILHNRSGPADRFRLEFFRDLRVQTIIDLSPLRKELFGAKSPAAVVIFHASAPRSDDYILHVSPRRTPIAEMIDGIVVPQQNLQTVARSQSTIDPSIWKTLLWGSPRDLNLVSHLKQSFGTLDVHARTRGWRRGPGFQLAKNGDKNDATHLHELRHLPARLLVALRAPSEDSLEEPITTSVMHRPREQAIYLAPHILMRKGFRETPVAAFAPYNTSFTDSLFALAGSAKHASELRAITAVLCSSVAQYWYLMTSSSWGVEREQLQQREWLSLPLPIINESSLAALSDIVAGGRDDWREQVDHIVEREVYKLTNEERQLISDSLTYKLSELKDGPMSQAYEAMSDADLRAYARALKQHLDSLELGAWTARLSETAEGYVRITCIYSDLVGLPATGPEFTIGHLRGADIEVLEESFSSATIVEPQAIILNDDEIHIVKPNRRVNWTVSAAAIDAADIFQALLSSEDASSWGGYA